MTPQQETDRGNDFHLEQQKITTLESSVITWSTVFYQRTVKMIFNSVAKAIHITILDHILYFVNHQRGNRKRVVVPVHLQEQILLENLGGIMAGHFSGQRLHNAVCRRWWWDTLHRDSIELCRMCSCVMIWKENPTTPASYRSTTTISDPGS